METAPLTLAHTHVRNAALESRRSNPLAASEEHDLAAAEFAAAAQGSSDLEALRILNLLEQHHKKLGQLLKAGPGKHSVDEVSMPPPTASATNTPAPPIPDSARPASPENTAHPPRLPRTLRSNTRDLSTSIASNLASARGIPSHRQNRPAPVSPLVSNQHADGHNAQDDRTRKTAARQHTATGEARPSTSTASASRPPWTPPVIPEAEAAHSSDKAEAPTADAPFQQFYSTFESLISKLSAPLAFAGLPLTGAASKSPESPPQPAPPSPKTSSQSAPVAPSVDYSQLISRAALRAVSGTGNGAISTSESFYVVPTTGGTISYAEIMNRAEREEARGFRHQRQASNLSNISEDDFVDASSTVLPNRPRDAANPSTVPGRFNRRGGAVEAKVNGKTMEELALENQALKHLSDTLSKRLHVFEMSAQTSSAALAQSIRSLHRSPLTTPLLSPETSRGRTSTKGLGVESGGGQDDALARRIAELEDILRKSDARSQKKDEENAKLRETISKYRDKWDSLKAGAKARRERERDGRATRAAEKDSDPMSPPSEGGPAGS